MSETSSAELKTHAKRMADFSSHLSPMLVKELRQGMRSNMFVIAFILLHTFMMLCLLTALSAPGRSDSDFYFWFIIISVLLFIQPLRGFNALSSEYQSKTMDLIHMTRLNGWRVTLGKWTALNAQGLLFTASVLPYLVIRYFLGNVNFIVDLIALTLIGIGSALATAVTIGCSAFPNILVRGVACIGLTILLSALGAFVTGALINNYGTSMGWEFLFLILLIGVFGTHYFLAFGASRISSLSENHATRKRLSALLATALCFGLGLLFGYDPSVTAGLATNPIIISAILCVAVVDALTEPLPLFARVVQPFSKNPIARFFGLFLTPGWLSGIFFFLAATISLIASLVFLDQSSGNNLERQSLLVFLSACNIVIFPLLIISLFFPLHTGSKFTFALYLLIQAIIGGITLMVVAAVDIATGGREELIFTLLPLPSVLIFAYEKSQLHNIQFLFIIPFTTILCIGVPLIRKRRSLAEFFHCLSRNN